jgi:3-oxoacyl-[acyl-carrier protein] reductase
MLNVIVSGASRGLGLAIVERLLSSTDYRLICVSRRPSSRIQELVRLHKERMEYYAFDVSEIDQIPEFVSGVVRKYGPIYGLINNAGVGLDGVLATQHMSEISKTMRINLEAPIILTKYACRTMLAQKTGRIINVTSIIASSGFNGLSVYAATKAGLEGFTRSLSRELGRAGITVNCIAPGYMETDMTAGLTGEKLASVKRRAPLGLPTPADVAATAEFLLSGDAKMMTGTVVTVDGGSTA